jgi:hypothetical protein
MFLTTALLACPFSEAWIVPIVLPPTACGARPARGADSPGQACTISLFAASSEAFTDAPGPR